MGYSLGEKYLDVIKYSPYGEPPCETCRNYEGEHRCRAFPDGIPQNILDGKHDHRRPYPGDHGVQYEHQDFCPYPPPRYPFLSGTGERPQVRS